MQYRHIDHGMEESREISRNKERDGMERRGHESKCMEERLQIESR